MSRDVASKNALSVFLLLVVNFVLSSILDTREFTYKDMFSRNVMGLAKFSSNLNVEAPILSRGLAIHAPTLRCLVHGMLSKAHGFVPRAHWEPLVLVSEKKCWSFLVFVSCHMRSRVFFPFFQNKAKFCLWH